jgi:hypothetical protein
VSWCERLALTALVGGASSQFSLSAQPLPELNRTLPAPADDARPGIDRMPPQGDIALMIHKGEELKDEPAIPEQRLEWDVQEVVVGRGQKKKVLVSMIGECSMSGLTAQGQARSHRSPSRPPR